jgi:lipoyl(octanoyl) transferase
MVYCIADLRDISMTVREYIDALEDVLIDTAAEFGVATEGRREGMRGIWTRSTEASAKMGAVGVSASRYIVTHGAALNVSTDLRYFEPIVACGLHDAKHTTISRETGQLTDVSKVQEATIRAFSARFRAEIVQSNSLEILSL